MNKLKQKFIKIVESDHNLYEQVLNRKHIETLGNKFTEATKEWLKQKSPVRHYLTEQEMNMSEKEVNLQIALGLKSCNTLDDVCKLLNDVRLNERQKLLGELEK